MHYSTLVTPLTRLANFWVGMSQFSCTVRTRASKNVENVAKVRVFVEGDVLVQMVRKVISTCRGFVLPGLFNLSYSEREIYYTVSLLPALIGC